MTASQGTEGCQTLSVAYPNIEQWGNVTIVGEAHANDDSKRLVQRVLKQVRPTAVAVEDSPLGFDVRPLGGLGAALSYAEEHQCTAAVIDETQTWIRDRLPDGTPYARVVDVANAPQSAVRETGEMPRWAGELARGTVRKSFGEVVFRTIYPEREKRMADRLRIIEGRVEGPVVAVIGAFHVQRVREFLDESSHAVRSIQEERVRDFASSEESK